jgi:hypothetical protein
VDTNTQIDIKCNYFFPMALQSNTDYGLLRFLDHTKQRTIVVRGRVISLPQSALPDNKQHSHSPGGIFFAIIRILIVFQLYTLHIPNKRQPFRQQTPVVYTNHALDLVATAQLPIMLRIFFNQHKDTIFFCHSLIYGGSTSQSLATARLRPFIQSQLKRCLGIPKVFSRVLFL